MDMEFKPTSESTITFDGRGADEVGLLRMEGSWDLVTRLITFRKSYDTTTFEWTYTCLQHCHSIAGYWGSLKS
jgi:hypothetical protein